MIKTSITLNSEQTEIVCQLSDFLHQVRSLLRIMLKANLADININTIHCYLSAVDYLTQEAENKMDVFLDYLVPEISEQDLM